MILALGTLAQVTAELKSLVSVKEVKYVFVSSVPSAFKNPPLLDDLTKDVEVVIPVTLIPELLISNFVVPEVSLNSILPLLFSTNLLLVLLSLKSRLPFTTVIKLDPDVC